MEPMTLGLLVLALVGGLGGILIFGKGASLTRLIGVGSAGGIFTTITGVYTKAWALIVGAFYGHLGMIGYAFVFALAACLLIWMWNAYKDYRAGRSVGFVD